MKLRLTPEDLSKLSTEQAQNLNDLWIPAKYDVAVASVCKDASTEEYEQIEFAVGAIELYNKNNMLLFDLRHMDSMSNNALEDEASLADDADDAGSFEDENLEDELDEGFEYFQPISFNKEDCLPLLNIGQMIEILQKRNFGNGDFYFTVASGDLVCDLGKTNPNYNNYDINNKNAELCDVLWESVKALL